MIFHENCQALFSLKNNTSECHLLQLGFLTLIAPSKICSRRYSNLKKKKKKMSSAAVVIGTLKVKV